MIRPILRPASLVAPAFAALLAFGAAPASAQSDPSVDLMLQAVAAGLPASAAPQLVQDPNLCASRGGQMLATTSGAQVCVGGIAAPGGANQLGTVSVPGIEAVRVETQAIPGQGQARQPVAFTAVPAPQGFAPQQFAAPAPAAIPQPAPLDAFAAPAPAPVQVQAPVQQFAAPVQQFAAPLPAALPTTTTTTTTQTYQTYSAPTASTGSDGFVTLNLQSDPAAAAACRQQGGITAHGMDGRFLCLTGNIYRDLPLPGQQVLPATIRTETVVGQ